MVRVPWHIGPLIIVAIKTEDIRLAEIFTIKLFEEAIDEVKHAPPATTIEHETTLPFANVDVV